MAEYRQLKVVTSGRNNRTFYLPPDKLGNCGIRMSLEENEIELILNHNGAQWEMIVKFADIEEAYFIPMSEVRADLLAKIQARASAQE
jgi:hypothetical protein